MSIQTANTRSEFAELPGTETRTEKHIKISEEEEDAINADGRVQLVRPSTHLTSTHAQCAGSRLDPAAHDTCLHAWGVLE